MAPDAYEGELNIQYEDAEHNIWPEISCSDDTCFSGSKVSTTTRDSLWEDFILPEHQPPNNLLEEDPNSSVNDYEKWWSTMRQWADKSFQPNRPGGTVLQAIDAETLTVGGTRFCCYGMIPNAVVRLVGNMTEIAAKIDPSQPYQSFDISKYGYCFMLKFPDASVFAQVSELISRGLTELWEYRSVEIRAFVETSRVYHVCSRAKKPSEATLKSEINIYGPADDARSIGNKLGSAKIFLQDPDHGVQDIEYYNPHVIQLPGIEEPASQNAKECFLTNQPSHKENMKRTHDVIDHTISTVYHSLTRSRNLERTQSVHVTTQLLPNSTAFHDTEGDRSYKSSEYSFWSYERNIMTPLYRHKLTHAESAEVPNELGGGILADDMGMGKSLSALALITRTFELAHLWSREVLSTTRELRARASLIIVPSTLIMNSWLKEVETHLDKSVTIAKYYGKSRDDDITDYLKYDIVFTTYHTIAVSMNQKDSVVFQYLGLELFLMKVSHMIRRRETTLHQAASQLYAKYRWCLTGTPIQNRLEDVGSLLAFLRIKELGHRAAFRNSIILPFSDGVASAVHNLAFLLDCVCPRRSQDLLHLPNITERYHYVTLKEDERKHYDDMLEDMSNIIKGKAQKETGRRDHFGIFQAQLQLRLLCNHGTFQKPFMSRHPRDRKIEREEFLYSLGTNAEFPCSMCGIPIPVFDISGGPSSPEDINGSCPLCRKSLGHGAGSAEKISSEGKDDDDDGYFNWSGFSSKIQDLMEDLTESPRDAKSIVFSGWTRTLDLISVHLRKRRMLFQRIDGDQSLQQRQYNMDRFMEDKGIPILLMSTGVGAFGLNLTVANHVYILEPQWNPSVESQAIGRVSRLGQSKPVSVTRYIVRGTVEVSMQSQQIRKVELAKVGFQDVNPDDS
ncbi:SNF2 family N-terminal domain-containing protein [Daldinia decipiens]|uniref:SNF2 family N-terminal domain-containing protein n=1 Tax=Daldinia decipiens TaxID=326647 RepID=UPI0020C1BD40|nr:SNF2 family N-terminal domain-containing protein [Daldinia decipiens]KAI1657698.1 SNF2 family N-terminal domain-containing protein [Daldinia decipiens]